jgi:DNA (cytosine-5)-methyltransferase 3A
MRVLSLFDGISCARVALGNRVTTYYASEVDKNAIKIAIKNFPDTQHVGDVRSIKGEDYPNIDLLIGGSPCQDLSIAKKGRKGLEGDRSGLFWEYVRIKKEINPKYFVLENVASMPKADRDIITKEMGVEPILINASLVSAQSRKRLFWTNLPTTQPEDRGILLKDILQPDGEVDERMVVNGKSFCLTATYSHANTSEAGIKNSVERKQRTLVRGASIRGRQQEGKWVNQLDVRKDDKASALTTTMSSKLALVKIGHIGNSDAQANRVYSPEGKSSTLSANGGGLGAKTGLYDVGCIRKLTPIECERLQGLPDNYTEGIAMTNRYKCLGNAFSVEVVKHILSSIH